MDLFSDNQVCKLFGIKFPIIQAGMVWVSGAKLAAASANAGCLGVIGAGSMNPSLLAQHIEKARTLTSKPLAVNLPLLYAKIEEQIDVALRLGIRIFITSAGSPKKFTAFLKEQGCTVVHVASTPALAAKCEQAGVDAVVVEGFEAGGHNGRDELTTMVLTPQCADAIKVPIIAAGGIGDGRAMVAALALGAQGVQIGSRFAATVESSAHAHFKQAIVAADPVATQLCMKELVPVRLLKNPFYEAVRTLEMAPDSTRDQLAELLGKGRAKKGMLEGDMADGELEIGQVSGAIDDVPTVEELVQRMLEEFKATLNQLPQP